MMEECGSPRKSVHWKPNTTYSTEMGMTRDGKLPIERREKESAGETAHIAGGTRGLTGENGTAHV
jgi:hypothetical protein